MESALPAAGIVKIEPKDDYDRLIVCSSSLSSDIDPWTVSSDVDMYADMVERENIASLDVIPQPALPSPDRNSDPGEAIGTMHTLIPLGHEENMSSDMFDQLEGVGSSDSSDVCLGTVSFDDILNIDYNSPNSVGDDLINALSDQLRELDDENKDGELPQTCKTVKVEQEKMCEKKYCLRERKHTVVQENSVNVVERKQKNPTASKTIILNQKDGSRKVLNVVPMAQQQENRPKHFNVTSTSTIGMSTLTRSCTRPRSGQDTLMYPDSTDIPEDKSRRNALQAKLNREKKKAYIASLEKQVSELSKDNNHLQTKTTKLQKERDLLAEEVTYLRSVIANQSTLSKLLSNITDVKSVSLTTSFSGAKKSFTEDHDYGQSAQKRRKSSADHMSGGVCLHVENENVSLEFCASCARMAKGASRSDVS